MRTVVKVEQTRVQDTWLVRDQAGSIERYIHPRILPGRVRDVVQYARRAYFDAVVSGGSIHIGARVVGDPGWV